MVDLNIILEEAFSQPRIPTCSTECAVSGLQKIFHIPFNTYTYHYTGRSEVIVKGTPDGKVDLNWSLYVDLSWVTPCDVIIELRNPLVMGSTGKNFHFIFEL